MRFRRSDRICFNNFRTDYQTKFDYLSGHFRTVIFTLFSDIFRISRFEIVTTLPWFTALLPIWPRDSPQRDVAVWFYCYYSKQAYLESEKTMGKHKPVFTDKRDLNRRNRFRCKNGIMTFYRKTVVPFGKTDAYFVRLILH